MVLNNKSFLVRDSYCQWCVSILGKCRYRTTTGYCCSFPFVYRGRRYNSCAKNKRGQSWCYITPDYKRRRLWGYCRGGARRKFVHSYLFVSIFIYLLQLNDNKQFKNIIAIAIITNKVKRRPTQRTRWISCALYDSHFKNLKRYVYCLWELFTFYLRLFFTARPIRVTPNVLRKYGHLSLSFFIFMLKRNSRINFGFLVEKL